LHDIFIAVDHDGGIVQRFQGHWIDELVANCLFHYWVVLRSIEIIKPDKDFKRFGG
jgi:hypothetical protein